MRRLFSIAALAAASLLLGGTVAVAGETCDSASSLPQGITTGDLGSATTRWFEFVAPDTADFGVNTHHGGTEFHTALSVRESCDGAPIAGDSGAFPGRKAYLRVPMTAGQSYLIELGRSAGNGSAFQISVEEALGTCPLAGDCFAANGDPGCDDSCGGPPCPGCCDLICSGDAFCCDVEWDQICADDAIDNCEPIVPVDLQSIDVERR